MPTKRPGLGVPTSSASGSGRLSASTAGQGVPGFPTSAAMVLRNSNIPVRQTSMTNEQERFLNRKLLTISPHRGRCRALFPGCWQRVVLYPGGFARWFRKELPLAIGSSDERVREMVWRGKLKGEAPPHAHVMPCNSHFFCSLALFSFAQISGTGIEFGTRQVSRL